MTGPADHPDGPGPRSSARVRASSELEVDDTRDPARAGRSSQRASQDPRTRGERHRRASWQHDPARGGRRERRARGALPRRDGGAAAPGRRRASQRHRSRRCACSAASRTFSLRDMFDDAVPVGAGRRPVGPAGPRAEALRRVDPLPRPDLRHRPGRHRQDVPGHGLRRRGAAVAAGQAHRPRPAPPSKPARSSASCRATWPRR